MDSDQLATRVTQRCRRLRHLHDHIGKTVTIRPAGFGKPFAATLLDVQSNSVTYRVGENGPKAQVKLNEVYV